EEHDAGGILRVPKDVEVRRVDGGVIHDVRRFAVARCERGRRREQRGQQSEREPDRQGRAIPSRDLHANLLSAVGNSSCPFFSGVTREPEDPDSPNRSALTRSSGILPAESMTPETDRALIARIEARDADALASLYDRHAARLLGLASRILGAGGEAEEVVQELFLYVWRGATTFDPVRGSVLAWLLVATRSRAIDRLRARRPAMKAGLTRVEQFPDKPDPRDIEADSATREWEALCRSAIAELPAEQRVVLELAYFEGLTHQEIAQKTSTPLGTVKTRVRLGLMKLRDRIRPYLQGGTHGA